MKKIFTLAAAVLASFSLWAADATFTMADIFDGSAQSAEVTEPVEATITTTTSKGNAKDGKLGSDGNYFEIILAKETFSAVSMNGFINTSNTEKNWAFQFSTDGGASWSEEATQANDGDKTAHDIIVSVDIPQGANGFRVVRRAGTATTINSITLSLGGGAVTPSTDPVAKVTLSGDAEAFVGQTVTISATTDVKANAYKWSVNGAEQEGADKAQFDFKAEAEGTFSIVCSAKNDNNADWVASEALEIVVSKKEEQPVGEVCAILLPASSGDTPAKGGEVALLGESKGGKIIFAGAKEDKYEASFLYTERGLQMSKGGADSVRVILDNKLVEGSVIQLKIWNFSADGKERGFKVLSLEKKAVLNASWTPAAEGEEKSFDYTVKKGDGLEGMNAFIIQRNNSAILEAVTVSGCGGEVPTAINNIEEAVKAVKVIRNGQLLIEKNGVLFNAQGAVVK